METISQHNFPTLPLPTGPTMAQILPDSTFRSSSLNVFELEFSSQLALTPSNSTALTLITLEILFEPRRPTSVSMSLFSSLNKKSSMRFIETKAAPEFDMACG